MWTVIIRDGIFWLFCIQNIDFILFFTSNLDLHNVISILQQFDSKIFGFISFLSSRTKIEYKLRTETCNNIILTYLEMIPFCTFCIKLHHFYIIIPDSNGNIFKIWYHNYQFQYRNFKNRFDNFWDRDCLCCPSPAHFTRRHWTKSMHK